MAVRKTRSKPDPKVARVTAPDAVTPSKPVAPVREAPEPVLEPVDPIPDPPSAADVAKVGRLLADSMKLHEQARSTKSGRPENWRSLLMQAKAKRIAAVVLDPGFTAPAWDAEQGKTGGGRDTHSLMMRFYNSLEAE